MAGARIRITSAKWYVKRVELTPGAIDATVVKMTNENALYPIDRIMYVSKQISGITSWELSDIWAGPIPNHVILGIVKASAVEGNITENPYNFANYELTRLQLTAGSRHYPANAFEPRFNGTSVVGSRVAREMLSTLEISGKAWRHGSNVGGNAIYTFDLTADGSHGTHWSLINRGAITISGTFANAPAVPVTVIVIDKMTSKWKNVTR